uniref:E3 ubiquitin-protein ligase MARCHF5 n=1 Tax=Lygus hesperus TaxID=30085 RepID=A0A0A9VX09_LYGHE
MDNRRNDPNLNRALAEREQQAQDGQRRSRVDNAVIVRGPSQTESSPTPPTEPAPIPQPATSSSGRQCWICFATDEADDILAWIQPCNCRGTTKWVHHTCLQIWIDEKLKEDRERTVISCPQCRTEYLIYYPNSNIIVRALDKMDLLIYKACPFIIGCYVVGAVYWTALSYGAVTFLHVGDEEAKEIMGQVHPLLMLVTLPLVPGATVVLGMLKWEESLLEVLRTISYYVPLTRIFLPNRLINESGASTERQISDGMSCTRVFAGAILLPVAAKICGDALFSETFESPLLRSMYGGLLFIGVKGLFTMYHKQQTYKRLSQRRILNFNEENRIFIAGAESHGNATQ